MSKLLAILAALSISSCLVYDDPTYGTNCFEFTDDYGTRTICNTRTYVSNGVLFYWDRDLNAWIGPRGYWMGGIYHFGYHPNYYNRYHGYYFQHHEYRDRGGRGGGGHHR